MGADMRGHTGHPIERFIFKQNLIRRMHIHFAVKLPDQFVNRADVVGMPVRQEDIFQPEAEAVDRSCSRSKIL